MTTSGVRFRIVQCLCGPARHAILALASKDDALDDDAVRALLQYAVEETLDGRGAALHLPPRMNPWCGLCGAPAATWVYEVGWSREFRDWDEAERVLRESEADQRATAALLGLLDVSYDARRETKKSN